MNEKGFTLVETITTLGIATVVGTLLVIIIVNTGGLFYKQASKVEQGLSVNDALYKVQESIKASSGIAASFTSSSSTFTTGPGQLVLKIPSIDSSGNVITNTFDHFVFFLDQKKLLFKVFPDAASTRSPKDQIFSTNADTLIFNYFDSQNQEVTPNLAVKVRVTLGLKQKAGAGTEQNIATSEANLRND